MSLSHSDQQRLEVEMQALKAKGVPFAMATVVRTVNSTSAKPGGKALVGQDGTILAGWVGGGCARGAVGKAARTAIETGAPQLLSLRPQDVLDTEGLTSGDVRDGVQYARNGCPSKGTMDVFVEPFLPLPDLVICGTGLVALALGDLAARFDFKVRAHAAQALDGKPDIVAGFEFGGAEFVVVATQGQGDKDALQAAVATTRRYVSFVGSTRKFNTLMAKLVADQPDLAANLNKVHAPAGLTINAITPDEIALSILAEITQVRREARTAGHAQ